MLVHCVDVRWAHTLAMFAAVGPTACSGDLTPVELFPASPSDSSDRPTVTPTSIGAREPPKLSERADAEYVTVVVRERGQPLASAEVIAHDAEGNAIGVARTGLDGRARLWVPAGGAVTTIERQRGRLSSDVIYTWTEVEPGDTVRFTVRRLGIDPGRHRVTIGHHLTAADEEDLEVDIGCQNWSESTAPNHQVLRFDDICRDADGARVALGRLVNSAGALYQYAFDRRHFDGGDDALDLRDWRADIGTGTVRVNHIPARVEKLRADVSVLWDALVFPIDVDTVDVLRQSPGAQAGLQLEYPLGFGTNYDHRLRAEYPIDSGPDRYRGFSMITTEGDRDIGFDLRDLLPPISQVSVSTSADGRHTIAWRIDGEPAGEDVALVGVHEDAPDHLRFWFVAVPPRETHLRLPEVPDLQSLPNPRLRLFPRIADAQGVRDYRQYKARHPLSTGFRRASWVSPEF